MATLDVPLNVCKELDKMLKKLWCCSKSSGGSHLVLKSWDDICKPKKYGGLNFRQYKDLNLALLSKLVWKIGK